jgi:hypothetical protein
MRADPATESRSAVTAAYKVKRTMRRENGTPGGGCALHANPAGGA